MFLQEFTASNLNKMRRPRAQFSYRDDSENYPKSVGEWKELLRKLEKEINSGEFRYRKLQVGKHRGKLIFSTRSLENILTIRKANENIRRAYRIKQANRFDVIKQVSQALQENTPKHVLRLDIRSFYESVPKRVLLAKIRTDRIVSTRTVELLEQLLKITAHHGASGLPRGLLISATLAELHAQAIERDIRDVSGVYYIARYVDDLIVFSYSDIESTRDGIVSAFKRNGVLVNWKKYKAASVQCGCYFTCVHAPVSCPCTKSCKCLPAITNDGTESIDALGYKLAFTKVNSKEKNSNDVGTFIADKKMKKYKARIAAVAMDYLLAGDYQLFRDRILFLTGNYRLEPTVKGGKLMGGIYYNFSRYEPFDDDKILATNRLEALDVALRETVKFCLSKSPAIARLDKRELIGLSFTNGHNLRRMRFFTPKRVQDIARCWRYA